MVAQVVVTTVLKTIQASITAALLQLAHQKVALGTWLLLLLLVAAGGRLTCRCAAKMQQQQQLQLARHCSSSSLPLLRQLHLFLLSSCRTELAAVH
jgi:hypothetical protein